MQFIQFGALTLPLQWLLALISLVGGWVTIRIFKRIHPELKESLDITVNSLFIWGGVWKFSVIIFDFPTVKSQLLAIVYFSGGTKGFFLGMIISVIYLIIKAKKKDLWTPLSEVILLWGTVGNGLYVLLNGYVNEENILTLIAYAFVLILFLIWLWEKNTENLQTKAGSILIVYAFVFQIPNNFNFNDLVLLLLFPLLSIVFNMTAIKKEQL
ncbi:hypothetical protein [Bacillus niameyensis]|uniref:hypothetical protein n=1 Tax=Bacillus niameyensis TaxID=1522308 RepID=UPI000782EF5E|nr:hypothetical protein [Bacillus niameyensis]